MSGLGGLCHGPDYHFRPRARILIESSTESGQVARCLEELGHEVIVADPNIAPMYAARSKKVQTDKRDARTLALRGLPAVRLPTRAPHLGRTA